MLLQLDTETEGAYLFCRSQGFAWRKCLQKGGNKIPRPAPAFLLASIRGKGQVGRARLCSASQAVRGEFRREQGRKHHTGSGQVWGTLSC